MQVAVSSDAGTLVSTTQTEGELQAALGINPPTRPADSEAAADGDGDSTGEDAVVDGAADADAAAASEAGKTLAGRKRSYQARIDDLTAKRRASDERAERAERELEALRRPATPPAPKAEPKADDYADYDTFERARAAHVANQVYQDNRLAEQRQADAARAEAEQAEIARAHEARVAAFKAATPDFEATVTQPIAISDAIRISIFESEVGPQLAYYFGKHPEEATRINALRGATALREIGKIETRLDAASSGPASTGIRESAPPPIKPVGTGASTASKLPLDHPDVSFKEYEQRRAAGER